MGESGFKWAAAPAKFILSRLTVCVVAIVSFGRLGVNGGEST